MSSSRPIALIQPPYLRLFGSHNNRVPLELAYLHGFLEQKGIASIVLNLDKTDATRSIPWSRLYDNSNLVKTYLEGKSPLLDESLERILSYDPRVAVIAAGDSLTPWVDIGNPYASSILSQALRLAGVYTIGVGPFFGRVPNRFAKSFDVLLTGVASPTICEIVGQRPSGVFAGADLPRDATPLMDFLDERDIANVVMTTVGCPFSCNFCLGASTGSRNLNMDSVVADIQSRPARLIEIGDAIFALSDSRLKEFGMAITGLSREFACEMSVARCTPARLQKLASLGVTHIKLGIESGSDSDLRAMGKRQTVASIMQAVDFAKSAGIRVTGYVLLGGGGGAIGALETLKLCRELPLDDLVVNVESHFDLQNRDFSIDSHWSKVLALHWGVADVMPLFFELQSDEKAGLGRLLPHFWGN